MQDGVDYVYYTYNTFFHIMNVSVYKSVLTYEMPWRILHKKWNLVRAETLTLLTKRNAVGNFVADRQIKLERNTRVKANETL